jgi:nicotinate-nucleotide adenylyltransferase
VTEPRGRGGIGLFGGTFNPIHLGHLRAAEEVREGQDLDEVRFMPAALPPHKEARGLATPADRLRMVELAVAGVPGFRVSDLELARPGPSYSIDSLRTVRTETGADARLVFILGFDAFREFHTWKDFVEIFALVDVVVVTRPPWPDRLLPEEIPLAAREAFRYDSISEAFRHASGHVLSLQRITALDISAAAIRDRVATRRSIRFLVPPAVERYVAERGLYRRGDSPR